MGILMMLLRFLFFSTCHGLGQLLLVTNRHACAEIKLYDGIELANLETSCLVQNLARHFTCY